MDRLQAIWGAVKIRIFTYAKDRQPIDSTAVAR